MAHRIDVRELAAAWRALQTQQTQGEGWRTIPVASDLPVPVRAGRHFPGNHEALLVAFRSDHLHIGIEMPEGRGFEVHVIQLAEIDAKVSWLSLSRRGTSTLDIFSAMCGDLLNSIVAVGNVDEAGAVRQFLERIAAWQYFMERNGSATLSEEAEIGLTGELHVLNALLDSGISTSRAAESWRGPLGAVRDFELGTMSLEVKSTTSNRAFPATISSFRQLDNAIGRSIYLAAIRLAVHPSGETLPELIQRTAARFGADLLGNSRFQQLALRSGFLASSSPGYTLRTRVLTLDLVPVTDDFPRLITSRLPPAFLRGTYVIDLDQVLVQRTSLREILDAMEMYSGTD